MKTLWKDNILLTSFWTLVLEWTRLLFPKLLSSGLSSIIFELLWAFIVALLFDVAGKGSFAYSLLHNPFFSFYWIFDTSMGVK